MPAGVFTAAPSTASWLRQAADGPVLLLPHWRAHMLGGVIALVSVVLGVLAQREGFPVQQAAGWLALCGVGVGMVLHTLLRKADGGWRVDFERRRIEPLGASPGAVEAVQIEGEGWSIQVAPGERRGQLAIDLRHEDRGRVVRLVDRPARRFAEVQRISDLADLLARRLQVARSGPTLQPE
jgi:hypothetical protein